MNKKAKIAVLILGCILVSVFTAGCGKKESEQSEADEVITKEAIIKESIPEETIAEEAVARADSSGSLINYVSMYVEEEDLVKEENDSMRNEGVEVWTIKDGEECALGYQTEQDFMKEQGLEGMEIFYRYDNPDKTARLILYYDPQTGCGGGIRYYERQSESFVPSGIYGFCFSETKEREWEGYAPGAQNDTLLINGETGENYVSDYKTGTELDDNGRVACFEASGIDAESGDDDSYCFLQVKFDYDDNGVVRHRGYWHNKEILWEKNQDAQWLLTDCVQTYFDSEGRPEFVVDLNRGPGTEHYYIYREGASIPAFELDFKYNCYGTEFIRYTEE
ncbi:MAG: hypothetical protein J5898_11205 [Lachnospiraceae bacterium]|nr:hypothetical protein [Lachnospiraceae bacterium]